MQKVDAQHPDQEKLAAFGVGQLSDAESQALELHIASCDECRQKVDEAPADSLVYLLRTSASGTLDHLADPLAATAPLTPAPESLPTAFTVPRELEGHARYLVLAPLGSGGMGTVYKARHRLMDRVVALKIVNPLLVSKPGAVERFTREVKAAAQLMHPNIVMAYDAEKVGDMHLLVMEFVAGQTLAAVLALEHQLPVARACAYLRQASLGLQHALEHGMVHRDIKPQNLMLTAKGEVKILDFGVARFVSELAASDGSTEQGTLLGSPDYMAPEQAQDAHAADARADIYGMGCTLYHLLVGHVPFPATSLLAKLEAHRDKQSIPLDQVRAAVPMELAKVVTTMMAKDPVQRYQTPAEVAEALLPFTRDEEEQASGEKKPPVPRAAPLGPRWLVLAIAIGLFSSVGGIGYWAAQIVFRVETPQGTLLVKTDDPDVQISVKSGGKEILLFFPKDKKEFPLKVGQYTIELVAGKDGMKLSTNKFEIKRGNDRKTVTVEFVPALAKVAGKEPPTQKAKEPDPDRRAAEYVLSIGGSVKIHKDGKELAITAGKDLPAVKTNLSRIWLAKTKVTDAGLEHLAGLKSLTNLELMATTVTDAGVKHLAGLTSLTQLALDGTKLTDAGLKHLAGLTNLKQLGIGQTLVTDAGLKHLAGLKSLTTLYLPNTKVTDAGVKELAALKRLTTLSLYNTKVTDAGLKHLAEAKHLLWVDLLYTQVTDAGVKRLRKALPRCRVRR